MLKVKVKRDESLWRNLTDNLRNINGAEVEVGHWGGIHGPSGMSYPDLLAFWAAGVEAGGVRGTIIQDVRKQFIFNYLMSGKFEKDTQVVAAIKLWFDKMHTVDLTDHLLKTVATNLEEEYKKTFNVLQGPFMDGTSTPLFETGELMNATTHKITKK